MSIVGCLLSAQPKVYAMRLIRADVHRIHYDKSIVNDSWHEMKKLGG